MARLDQVLSWITRTSDKFQKFHYTRQLEESDESVRSWATEVEAYHSQTEASGSLQLSWNMQWIQGRAIAPHLPRGSMMHGALPGHSASSSVSRNSAENLNTVKCGEGPGKCMVWGCT